jgi:hypothetical protein
MTEHAKLIETFLRVPEALKHQMDKLTSDQKKALDTELRVVMARHVHLSRFNPDDYLQE